MLDSLLNGKLSRRDLLRGAAAVGLGSVAGSMAWNPLGPTPRVKAQASRSSGGSDTIRVVGIFPLSGLVAADGIEMRNGVVMAIDEINEMGGILGRKLEYIEVDNGNSFPEDVTTSFRRAVDTLDPDVIFSGYHLGTGPEFDIVASAGRLYYNVNTQQRWVDLYRRNPQRYWGIFQCDPVDTWYGVGFARWLDRLVESGQYRPPAKTAAILRGDDPYGSWIAQNFREEARRLGWTITYEDSFTPGQVADWGPMLARVRANPPAMLFTTSYNPADNAALSRQFAANPMNCLVYQQYGPSVPEYFELAGDSAEGVIWATVLGFIPDETGMSFRERYRAKFGQWPGWANAPGCYDEVWLWAKAAALAGDPKDYRRVAAMTERMIHRGVTGSISFIDHAGVQYPDQTRDPSLGQPHIIAQVQNGENVVISPAPYNQAEFKLPPWFR